MSPVLDEDWMRQAVELARQGFQRGDGGPFGAIVLCDGKIVGRGWNQVLRTHDPTAHAEIVAIREASRALGRHHLIDCRIITSCEPCPMCLGAIYWARLSEILFACSRYDAASIGFSDEELYREVGKPIEHRSIRSRQLVIPEASRLFADFLRSDAPVLY